MKIVRLAIASVIISSALAAQQPTTPPVNPITTAFKTRTTGARKNIAQALDSIPESKFSYKPTPAQLSIGYIANHVAEDNYFFCNNFGDKKAPTSDEDKLADSVKAKWPKAKLMEKLRAANAFCDDAMNQLDDSNIGGTVSVPGPNNTTRQVSRVNYVLGHAIDLADHYSQLSNYMRLNNILPPTALPRPGRGN